jgi:ABC-2 type transport system ATP-binding protein
MIDARGLARTFRGKGGNPVEAVRGVDFTIAAGEIVAFLGPNGAGKTTTQRMLATLLTATAGEATVAGCDLRRDPVGVRRRIGYVAQSGSTNGKATVAEDLVVQGRLYGMSAEDAGRRGAELRTRLDLAELGDRRNETLSGGQRRRVDIALGLIHDPKLVFLDEPSTGLDPQSRANLWTHIRALRDQGGATVFLTTHYLDEADALADRILIIDSGKIVAEGSPAQLKRRISGDLIVFEVAGGASEHARELLAAQPGVRDAKASADGTVQVIVDHGDAAVLGLANLLQDASLTVGSLAVRKPTLDDVFLTLTGRSLREQA